MRFRGRRFDTGELVWIETEGRRVKGVEPTSDNTHAPWVAPGFVDLQVNGGYGQEFNVADLTIDDVAQVCRDMDRSGVTKFCPTATTHSFEMLAHTMSTLAAARRRSTDVSCRVAGFHLEGPYISTEDGPRGAHPREHCRPPDWDEFQRLQEAADGQIRILTLSPEYEAAPAFISQAVQCGVIVAIGHTAADSAQIQAAVDAGATLSTHLGNGSHGQLRRHPNYIWDQLAEDRLISSLIVDGHHLPPSVVKCFVRAKSPERCLLISDLAGMAGMPAGHYAGTSVGEIEILSDGRLVVAGQQQYLAGASRTMPYGVANLMRYAEVDLRTAIDMATRQPAELIRETPVQLDVGALADLVLFELPPDDLQPLQILATMNAGEWVYRREGTG
jgi:N-acetylglucosamine-6-phosphate deacetylase